MKTPDFKSSNATALPYGSSVENSTTVRKSWSRSFPCFAQCLGSYSSFLPGNSFTCIKNSYKTSYFKNWTEVLLQTYCAKTWLCAFDRYACLLAFATITISCLRGQNYMSSTELHMPDPLSCSQRG